MIRTAEFPLAQATRARALHRLGREAEVDAVLVEVERLARERGTSSGAYWADFLRAQIHLWRGELAEAERSLDAAVAHPTIVQYHLMTWMVRGQLLDAQGDAAGAARAYARAHRAWASPYWFDPAMAMQGLYLKACAEETAGDPVSARETYREFSATGERPTAPFPRWTRQGRGSPRWRPENRDYPG